MIILIVGSEATREHICQGIPRHVTSVFHLLSPQSALGFVKAYHTDVMIVDEDLIYSESTLTVEGMFSDPYARSIIPIVISESADGWGYHQYGSINAWRFSITQDMRPFLQFCEFLGRNEPLLPFGYSLSGEIPSSGIRQILPLIGAGRRSGRFVVCNGNESGGQHVLWFQDGDIVYSSSNGDTITDSLEIVDRISTGWFSFIEASIDNLVIEGARSWYNNKYADHSLKSKDGNSRSERAANLRERFRNEVASAGNLKEIERILAAFLEMGIDKAAEHEDVILMDKLADLSILLEKNELGRALQLLRELREEPTG